MISQSAPGKLYIAGEYAVVEPGHQALLVAVDRFITVRVTPAEHTGRITSALYETRYLTWYRSPDGTVVVERQSNDYVVSAIRHVEQVVREGGRELRFFDLDVHSELAEPDGRKLGLGSSAAVTVATVRAVAGFYDLPLDDLAVRALEHGLPVIGIGDGGNEAGMGALYEPLKRLLPEYARCLSRVPATVCLPVDVSNWGGTALAALLSAASGRWVGLSSSEEERALRAAVGAGAVDGTTGCRTLSVDGFSLERLERVTAQLEDWYRSGKDVLNKDKNNA